MLAAELFVWGEGEEEESNRQQVRIKQMKWVINKSQDPGSAMGRAKSFVVF